MENGLGALQVVVARIEQSTSDMNRQLYDIQHDIKGLEQSNQALIALDVKVSTVVERVGKLEDSQKWLSRLVFGAVIAAIMGLILIKTGVGIKIG